MDSLLELHSKVRGFELAEELAWDRPLEVDFKQEVKDGPETVILAFIDLVDLHNRVIWDQFLVEKLLLPAIVACKNLSVAVSQKFKQSNQLYKSLMKLQRDRDLSAISTGLFKFGHEIGCVHEAACHFG